MAAACSQLCGIEAIGAFQQLHKHPAGHHCNTCRGGFVSNEVRCRDPKTKAPPRPPPLFFPISNSWSSSGDCQVMPAPSAPTLPFLPSSHSAISHSLPFDSTSCFLFGSYFISFLLVLPPVPFFSSALLLQSRKAPPALSEHSSGCCPGRGGATRGAGSTWWPCICWASPQGEIGLLPAQAALPRVVPLARAGAGAACPMQLLFHLNAGFGAKPIHLVVAQGNRERWCTASLRSPFWWARRPSECWRCFASMWGPPMTFSWLLAALSAATPSCTPWPEGSPLDS